MTISRISPVGRSREGLRHDFFRILLLIKNGICGLESGTIEKLYQYDNVYGIIQYCWRSI